MYLSWPSARKKIPSTLCGPGWEFKKYCMEWNVGRDQSEANRKRPHCLTKKMRFLVPHFLDHPVLLRSISVTQFLTVPYLCHWWCASTGHHRSRKWFVSDLHSQNGQDWGGDTGLSGCDGTGPLHHILEACRTSHSWCRLSVGLLFARVGTGWMGLSKLFCQPPPWDVSQGQNPLRKLCIRAPPSAHYGDGRKSWFSVKHDLWSLRSLLPPISNWVI
jgi:hypothetical protein